MVVLADRDGRPSGHREFMVISEVPVVVKLGGGGDDCVGG